MIPLFIHFNTPTPGRTFKETYFIVDGRTHEFSQYEWSQRKRKTLRGDLVQSIGEQKIADFLFNAGFTDYIYSEEKILYSGMKSFRFWPDFYLPEQGLIIEFFGMPDDQEYQQKTMWKLETYKRCKQPCIAVLPKHLPFLGNYLNKELKKYQNMNKSDF